MTTLDLGFGFDDPKFSDKKLCIAILPDDGDHDQPNNDHEKPTSGCKRNDHDEGRDSICDDQLKILEGDASQHKEPSSDELHHSAFQEKSINVSSLILAGHSPFFLKLFSNGMKESGERQAIIHIQTSEEAAFTDMLKFMYSAKLSSSTPAELVQLLRIADRFSVASCVKHCSQLLNSLPMTIELALLYLDLDSTGLMVDSVKKGLAKAKKFLPEHLNDMSRDEFREELLALPLAGVEAVLSSDCLQIISEDKIYYFIMEWVQKHYADQVEERRKMLNMLLRRYLRFPYISYNIVKNILSSRDIDHEAASEIALGSLGYHLGQPPQQHSLGKFVKREYKRLCLKVIAFDNPSSQPQCTVFLDLKRAECEKMFPGGHLFSQNFFLGEHELALCADCCINEQSSFGLYFCVRTPEVSKTARLSSFSCDISSMQKPFEDFEAILQGRVFVPVKGQILGWTNLFSTTWERFISEDSPYFIGDILHLRLHLKTIGFFGP